MTLAEELAQKYSDYLQSVDGMSATELTAAINEALERAALVADAVADEVEERYGASIAADRIRALKS